MVAEIIKYYWPKLIDLHNYVPASSLTNKISNWNTLNRKVNIKSYKYPICYIIKLIKCVVKRY